MAATMDDLIGAMSGKVHVSQDGYDLNALQVSLRLLAEPCRSDKSGIPSSDHCSSKQCPFSNNLPTSPTITFRLVHTETPTFKHVLLP